MLCRDIMKLLNEKYPQTEALEWDNVGLIIGRQDKEVHKVYVALDVTDEIIEDAILQKADFLLTHHPLIFSPLPCVTDEDFIGKRVVRLLQHDICYYAIHTNYDVTTMGALTAELLKLSDLEVLEETASDSSKGIGQVGLLNDEITLREFSAFVKKQFSLPEVRFYGNPDAKIRRVAVCPGSGKHMSQHAIEKKAQVLVTGDMDYHECLDAKEQGLAVIDAGHYGLEHIFIEDVARYIKENMVDLEVAQAAIAHPFQVV